MRRTADWEERLAAFLEPLRGQPFAYGTHDCCTFVAGAVLAMTGEDSISEFRGRYSSQRGAAYALRKFGAGTLAATLTAKLGEPLPPAHAHRGDVVMAGGSLGISFGHVALMVGTEGTRDGIVRVPMSEWERAWRVPFVETAHG